MTNYLWLDLETTGLDPELDHPLEIGVILATEDEVLWEREWVFHNSGFYLTPEIQEMHTANGLLEECTRSILSTEIVDEMLAQMVPAKAHPAGRNVAFDLAFCRKWFPHLFKRLHYRCLDLTTLDLFFRYPFDRPNPQVHRALPDLQRDREFYRRYRLRI